MKASRFAPLLAIAFSTLILPAAAGDEEACLECHEPAEDWAGMSQEEWLAAAKDPGNKRHKDNKGLSEEQLKAIFATLMPK